MLNSGRQNPGHRVRCLVVIGASTGGPRTVAGILSLLPVVPAAFVVVQHMPKFINDSLIRTLSKACAMNVCLAQDGERLQEGEVVVAPSERHMTLEPDLTIRLVAGEKVNYVCPAIDVTMQSLHRREPGTRLIGVLLTGMGKDGAAGLAHIKACGGTTIAQEEKSCAVFGMPREAIKLGCVDHVLTPDAIAEKLTSLTLATKGATLSRELGI